MDHIAHLLQKALSKRGIREHAEASYMVYNAEKWLHQYHPELAGALTVERAKDGTLVIACSHSIAMQECQSFQHELLQYLQIEHPDAHLLQIRIMRANTEKKKLAHPSFIP